MIDLLIPLEVPSQNTRDKWHWSKRSRETKAWERYIRAYIRPGDLDKATGKRLVTIRAYRRQRCRDAANLVGGCKGLIDALVRVGLLIDDDRAHAEFTYAEEVASKSPMKRASTKIEIEDLP